MPAMNRIAVPEIAQRLGIGRIAVYTMLERGIIPGIRIGRRWIVTHAAYEQWERTCGLSRASAEVVQQERSRAMAVFKRKYRSGKMAWCFVIDAPIVTGGPSSDPGIRVPY